MTAMPGVTGIAYDVRNRLTAAGGDQYSHRPDNKRLWKKLPGGAEEVYFYSIAGEKLGTYEPTLVDMTLYLKFKSTNVYYAGTLIRSEGLAVVLDRLGSVRSFGGTAIRYFPYGEEQTSTPNDRQKFGTYYRDASTGLDYANQRYYGSGVGRFASADPLQNAGGLAGPGAWNQFAYVDGDPVNVYDPTGLFKLCPPGTRTSADAKSCVPIARTFRPPVVYNNGGGPGSRPGPETPNLEVPPDIEVPFSLGNSLVVGPCGGTVLLTPLQLDLLRGVGGWDALDRGQRAGFLNITGQMSNLGLNFLGMQLTSVNRDRLIFGPPTQDFRDSFDSLLASGVFRLTRQMRGSIQAPPAADGRASTRSPCRSHWETRSSMSILTISTRKAGGSLLSFTGRR